MVWEAWIRAVVGSMRVSQRRVIKAASPLEAIASGIWVDSQDARKPCFRTGEEQTNQCGGSHTPYHQQHSVLTGCEHGFVGRLSCL